MRQRRWGRWLAVALLAVGIISGAYWILSTLLSSTGGVDASDKVSSTISGLVALLTFGLTVILAIFPQVSSGPREAGSNRSLIDEFREWVRAFSAQEEEHRRVLDPRALPVRWKLADHSLLDHWSNIGGCLDGGLNGSFHDIRETYRAVPSGRLVILGQAGAGKTALAHHLIIALLDGDESARVPALFSLSDWNPRDSGLREWMVQQLVRNYPFLEKAGQLDKSTVADDLVRSEGILPILDGFDEIAYAYRGEAINELSAFNGPVVVTSRPEDYSDAVAGGKPISRAVAIEIGALGMADVERYLCLSGGKGSADLWVKVFRRCREELPTSASQNLSRVLSTPLMVMLARATYNDSADRDPNELLDHKKFQYQNDVEEHLLSGYLDALYDPRRLSYPPTDARMAWSPRRARRWLGALAVHLAHNETHDLVWWQLPSMLQRIARIFAVVVSGGLLSVLGFALSFVAADIAVYGYEALPGDVKSAPVDSPSIMLGFLFSAVLAGGFAIGLINEVMCFRSTAGRSPERMRLRLRPDRPNDGTSPSRPRWARTEIVSGLAVGVALGLVIGLANGLGVLAVYGGVDGSGFVLGVVVVGLAVGLPFGLVNIVVSYFGDVPSPRDAINPWTFLASDRTVTIVRTIFAVVVATLAAMLADFLGYGRFDPEEDVFVLELMYALFVGFVCGVARFLLSAWGNWILFVRLWLPLTGRLPWRTERFLKDAYLRGALRKNGGAYQFRHARLRDHLVATHC